MGCLQHEQRKCDNECDKRERKQRKEAQAIKRDFQIPEEEATPPLLGFADFGLTIGANVTDFVSVADSQVTFHRGHPDFIVKFLVANRTFGLHTLNIV